MQNHAEGWAAGDYLSVTRTEALQDAVFAIVLTLLILEFKVPELAAGETLARALLALRPVAISYVLTFINLGVYWVGQHNQFHYIKMADRVFLWINLFFLMFVSLLPFTTALLGRYPDLRLPYAMYGLHLIAIGIIVYGQWSYATKHHRLTDHDVAPWLVRAVKRRILVAPAVSALAIAASLVSMPLSLFFYVLLPFYYIWPGRFDDLWRRPAIPHKH